MNLWRITHRNKKNLIGNWRYERINFEHRFNNLRRNLLQENV